MAMLSAFSLLLALGSTVGLVLSAIRSGRHDPLRVIDQGLFALTGALLGARTGYVVVNWTYFQAHLEETWQVWLGGLSGSGAAYGFVVFVCLGALLGKDWLGEVANDLLVLGLTLTIAGWLAVWVDGSAYGPKSQAWYALPARDQTGAWTYRWPLQLVGALLTLGLWVLLDRLPRRGNGYGRAAALGLAGVGAIWFCLSFLRADPLPQSFGLRLDTWGALGLVLLGAASWLLAFISWKRSLS